MLISLKIILVINILIAVNGIQLPKDCGKQLNTTHSNWRIIGGTDAAVGEFPWQIVLDPGNNSSHVARNFCGGTVINNKWILTAAHCMVNFTFNIRLGVHNESIHESGEVISAVEKIIIHERYDPSHISNDIALLKLNETLDFKNLKNIGPICLPKSETKLTKKCVATGWGNTSQKGFEPPKNRILKKVDLPIVDSSTCKKAYKSIFIESTELCAGGSASGGRATCQMDSGGPLQCLAEDGRWYQLGVTSYGPTPCGMPNSPDVFTKVASYVDWIEKKLADN